ncbi:class I histocompatibility antigen, F10 alpha chain-like, partial [Astyanax mexicanus]
FNLLVCLFDSGSLCDQNLYQVAGFCSLYPNGTYATFMSTNLEKLESTASQLQKSTGEKVRYVLNSFLLNCINYKIPELQQKKRAGSVTVTCHVTGFYPREVQVFWLGPDLQPVDEEVTEILPNGDGTYQTRKSVIVPEEDVGKQNYSCVVLHISVPNNITTVWGTIYCYTVFVVETVSTKMMNELITGMCFV